MNIQEEHIVAGIVGIIALAFVGMVAWESVRKKGGGRTPVIHGAQDVGEEMIAGFRVSEIFPSA